MVNNDMIAIASANIKEMIIVTSIFGDAEGFLDRPLTDSRPTRAITIDGPNVLMSIMSTKDIFFI